MNPGDVIHILLPQLGGGPPKLRPALLLADLPGYSNWDELIQASDLGFPSSGLYQPSVIRLSYLYAADSGEVAGSIGSIDVSRLQRLRQRLSDHLRP